MLCFFLVLVIFIAIFLLVEVGLSHPCCCFVGVLRPFDTFQVISGAVSYSIHTVPGQASMAVYQFVVHILSPVTDNCPS